MTVSDVVFDSWAWVEVFLRTKRGIALRAKYVAQPQVRLHASALAVGELVARLDPGREAALIEETVVAIEQAAILHDVTPALAREGAVLRHALRKADPGASLADGIMLATARSLKATLVSADPAFKGLKDVTDA